MSAYGLRRNKRKGGSGPRSKDSVTNDLWAIRDIYEQQLSEDEARMMWVGHPRIGNVPLTNLLKRYGYSEAERRDVRQAEQSGVALCDGEAYSRDQHRQVLGFGLKKDGNPAAAKYSESTKTLLRCYHAFGHYYLMRCEGRDRPHIRDMHV